MKNEVLSIIEKGKGITGLNGSGGVMAWTSGHDEDSSIPGVHEKVVKGVGSFRTINMYLRGHFYEAKNYCPQDDGCNYWYGVTSLEGDTYELAKAKEKYYWCFAKFDIKTNSTAFSNNYNRYFYKVRLFYKMEFPVLSNWIAVKVDGRTAEINDVQDGDKISSCENALKVK